MSGLRGASRPREKGPWVGRPAGGVACACFGPIWGVFSAKVDEFVLKPHHVNFTIACQPERDVGLEGGESPASGDRPVRGPSDWLGGCVRLFGASVFL